jgi:hypothetical protein
MVRTLVPGKVEASRKPYKVAVDDLVRSTEVRLTDLDAKFFQLLDKLQQKGRALEGVKYLSQSLDGIERTRIVNWRAYVYTLLRKFDEVTYREMKSLEEVRSREAKEASSLEGESFASQFNTGAPEFTPGVYWSGRLIGTTPRADFPGAYSFCLPTEMLAPLAPAPELFAPPDIFASPPPKNAPPGDLGVNSSIKELPKASPLIEIAEGPLPSPGSAGHSLGTCKPCAFLYTKGCANGENCEFCHLCDAEEKKRRKAQKRQAAKLDS